MNDLILLKAFYHKHEAEMAVGLLKEGGVIAILQSDDAGGFRHHLTLGVGNNRVMIQRKDAQKALELIKVLDDNVSIEELKQIEEEAVNSPRPSTQRLKKKTKSEYTLVIPFIVAALFIMSYYFQESKKSDRSFEGYLSNMDCQEGEPSSREYIDCKE